MRPERSVKFLRISSDCFRSADESVSRSRRRSGGALSAARARGATSNARTRPTRKALPLLGIGDPLALQLEVHPRPLIEAAGRTALVREDAPHGAGLPELRLERVVAAHVDLVVS